MKGLVFLGHNSVVERNMTQQALIGRMEPISTLESEEVRVTINAKITHLHSLAILANFRFETEFGAAIPDTDSIDMEGGELTMTYQIVLK